MLQGGLAARAPGKHLRQPFEQLPLPCGHLVRMKLVPRRDRLHAVPLAQRLERYPCLELRREPPSLPGHLGASSAALESTLTTCPKNRDHLSNVFDVLVPLGVGALLHPLIVGSDTLYFDLPALALGTVVLLVFLFRKRGLQRREAAVLLTLYVVYAALCFLID